MDQVRTHPDHGGKRGGPLSLFTVGSAVLAAACSPGRDECGAAGRAGDHLASIKAEVREIRAHAGETAEVALRIKNEGLTEWRSSGPNPVFVSFHLLDAGQRVLRFDNPRTPLPGVIRPGEAAEVSVRLKAPLAAGDYRLEFDLLREGLFWFLYQG